MPDFNIVEVIFIMDRSGSMQSMIDEAIGGFNAFLDEQKKVNGTARMTYVQFDHEYTPVFSSKLIRDVDPLTRDTYVPRGTTALYDAVGRTINEAGERFANMAENEKPGKVIVAVMTDGYENASQEFNRSQIKALMERQEKEWNWDFVYLSSSPTAQRDAQVMGYAAQNVAVVAADAHGTRAAYKGFSNFVSARSAGGDVKMSDLYAQADDEVRSES